MPYNVPTAIPPRTSLGRDPRLDHFRPQPAYLRVKIWRRLQGIGAIAVKNAVHVLPMSEEAQEDFEWLLREIEEGGVKPSSARRA